MSKNTGHGYVSPREDGMLARCGGPGICDECSFEKAIKDAIGKDIIEGQVQLVKRDYYILEVSLDSFHKKIGKLARVESEAQGMGLDSRSYEELNTYIHVLKEKIKHLIRDFKLKEGLRFRKH